MKSDYQIDVFPNGKGDAALVIRYGKPGDYKIVVYNGGTPKTGKEIAAHIRYNYQTDVVDDVVCSHPSSDLALGVCDIMDALKVKRLWMHRPWVYSMLMAGYFCRRRQTPTALAVHFEENFSASYLVELVAGERQVALFEPFQGTQIGPFTVMSPHRDFYMHMLVPELEEAAPSARKFAAEARRVLKRLRAGTPVVAPELESWDVETLPDGREGEPEHEAGIVLYGKIGGRGILLTGNAGLTALTNCARYAESRSLLIPDRLGFVQMPRHGDADHVSPSLLDRLIGAKYRDGGSDLIAMISKKSARGRYHDQLVVNALLRRGARVMGVDPKDGRLTIANNFEPSDHQIIPFRAGATTL